MIPSDTARPDVPRKQWLGWCVFGIIILVALLGGALMVRPDLRNDLAYRLDDHSGTPASIAYAVPPNGTDAPSIRLAVAGDVGTGGSDEYRTAAAMDRLEGTVGYDALLLLGDNVYPNGDPTMVQQKIFDPFADVLDGTTQLLPVLGNHDVLDDNGDGQVAALDMPGRWYATTIGDTLVLSLDSTRPDDPEQLAWLDDTLSSTDATWKIATLHHPPYSGGYHGSSVGVRDAFSPIFERHGVQLVLAGHDHDYQRSEVINGVTYVVSGGAADTRAAHLADFSVAAWSELHFVDIGIWTDRLKLRAIDQDGNVFDEVTLTAPADRAV